ncbi:hypothetical protein FACS1894105_03550 [Clostridia bacterium]|nr:hypothetical protein FACS1894105_03550 [Clostridia bacterium]
MSQHNLFPKTLTDDYFDAAWKRFSAFLQGEVADRPPVSFTFRKPQEQCPKREFDHKSYANHRERWLDFSYRALDTDYNISCTEYYSDAFPSMMPNLGPEIFSAMCGCPYEFGPDTTWSSACITDWDADADKGVFDRNSDAFRWVDEFTRELLKYSRGKFAVGFTDFHAGADHLAALRDPAELCLDLLENPEYVKAKLETSYREFFKLYDYFYNMITLEGEATSAWIPVISPGKYNVTQNDFSCMVSSEMFREFFYQGLIDEAGQLDATVYHLDGPGALKHLDDILDVKRINAVQWVPGAGNDGFDRWIDVYKRIQKAHKGIYLGVHVSELDSVFANLKPDGVWFPYVAGVGTKDEADAVLKRVANWK